jgi:hypothetical protein
MVRVCRKCKAKKPEDDFYARRFVCKLCYRAHVNATRDRSEFHPRDPEVKKADYNKRKREQYAAYVAVDRQGYNRLKREQYHRRKAAKQGVS